MTGTGHRAHAWRHTRAVWAWATLALAAGLPLAAWAQGKGNPELQACAAANRDAVNDLGQSRDNEIRRHAMHAVLVSRLQGMGQPLAQLRTTVTRNPRNLAECEQATQAITALREQIERIVGTGDQQAECVKANQTTYAGLQAILLGLQGGGKLSAPALESAAARVDRVRAAATRGDATLADCRHTATELGEERAVFERLAPPPPSPPPAPSARLASPVTAAPAASAAAAANPAACRQAQARNYNEVAQAYAKLVGSGSIASEWMAPLQSLNERLTRLYAVIADPAAPGWDCETILNDLVRARNELAQFRR